MKEEQLKWEITTTGNEIELLDNHVKVKELYGAFGQGQKILTVPQIAKLHVDNINDKKQISRKIERINALINNNLILESGEEYFEFGIDIIDLKIDTVSNGMEKECLKSMINNKIYTQNSVNKAKNLYILSEQGYSLLINLMTDPRSKIIYKNVIRDYFRMKKILLGLEDTQQYMMRIMGKKERKKMTDSIKYYIDRGDLTPTKYYNPYAVETNFNYKILFGMTKDEIVNYLGVAFKNKNDTLRNYLSYEDVVDIMEIENRISYMQQDGKSYNEIRDRLKELYPNTRNPKLAGKDTTFIKQLLLQG
ncbi:hypothetical protein [Clostridium botulinum]|uniref:hypothetical protein n=1 Tax=Clostridium botulinum TaxID=1491 RepID=UPI001C9A7BE6|nr:hypothetical protein [Clostridium botulinum]MBY6838790.1 hypothetical protein [Clostridium botulinum]